MNEKEISIDKWFKKKISISFGLCFIILILLSLCVYIFNFKTNRTSLFGSKKDTTELEIGSLIRKVKMQLMKADSEGRKNKENALLRLKSFQMEISFSVKKNDKAGGNLDYKFVTIEAGSEIAKEQVQKLTLNWDAIGQLDSEKTVTSGASKQVLDTGNKNKFFIK